MPEFYIRPESQGFRLSEAFVGESVIVKDLGCDHRSLFQFHGIFQVIDHGMSLKAVDKVSKMADEFLSLSVKEKVRLIKNVHISSSMDLNDGFSNNKDLNSATAGFYTKGDPVQFQKIKYIKYSKGGRVENIRPGRITRLRRRRNKNDNDDEDDGENNRQPADSRVLSLFLGIVIILMLFLILFSLIVWLIG